VAEFQDAPFCRRRLYPEKLIQKSRAFEALNDSRKSLRFFRVVAAGFVLQIYLTIDQSCFR
jgi:hypothetical protein